ncbi:lysosomal acid lipase/cholesteryl ester hydrolase-like [Symsagittifera roscoffensis]|uniref:lysosomal acid lipase/cholesteryl ester hydrolase-like n=1 Tax=Symsagittifera roscoffensis TaxID=84072 RepID=UPI00307BA792
MSQKTKNTAKNAKTMKNFQKFLKLKSTKTQNEDVPSKNSWSPVAILVILIPLLVYFSLRLFINYAPYFVEKEIFASTCELADMYNYSCSEHKITTQDGYILSMQRIGKVNSTNFSSESNSSDTKVALLMHCLECDSSVFLSNTAENSLGFLLAENNIDVWLANVRGTSYSLQHVNYTIYDSEFWNFSLFEMAKYDLTASVDYLLTVAKTDQIFYIGQSQGTIIAFSQMAENFDFQAKIKKAYMLTPFVTLQNIQSPIKSMLAFIHNYIHWPKNSVFLPDLIRQLINKASATYCSNDIFGLCLGTYHQFSGLTTPENMDPKRIPIFFTHALSGTSLKTIRHYAQLHLFKQPTVHFDYQEEKLNFEKYGSKTPPKIALEKVSIPIALFAGQNDWLVSSLDVQYLLDRLPNVFHFSNSSDFSHLDFIFGTRAKELVYDFITEDISKV